MTLLRLSWFAALRLIVTVPLALSLNAADRAPATIYEQLCANCHGRNLQGGSGPSLVDPVWVHGSDDAAIARGIRDGYPQAGMPPLAGALTPSEIDGLVSFLREQRAQFANRPAATSPASLSERVYTTQKHTFRLELVADKVRTPWALAWLPDGRMLITEKGGTLRIVENGVLHSNPVAGTPVVRNEGQGGLMEVALHPNYDRNGWIYLAYSDPARDDSGRAVSLTKIVRGRIRDGAWIDQQTVFEAPLKFYRRGGGVHFGCRIAFDRDGYLYFSHGERGSKEDAQDLSRPNGKVHRIHDDGRVPADNPFVNRERAFPTIWSYGNRNPQGLDFDPRTGLLWATEHGPRGGDELNLIRPGKNYGWPVITYGINYNGTPITDKTEAPGMEQPVIQWTPSIAVCGLDFYEGDAFPAWKHNLLVGALAHEEVRRVVIEGDKVASQEVILKNQGRVRDVASGPDGYIYVALNGPDRVIRLVPAATEPPPGRIGSN